MRLPNGWTAGALAVVVLLPAALTGCGECSDCDKGSLQVGRLEVRVIDKAQAPVSGAIVRLEYPGFVPRTQSTGPAGTTTFELVEVPKSGTASLTVSPPDGFRVPPPTPALVSADSMTHVTIALEALS